MRVLLTAAPHAAPSPPSYHPHSRLPPQRPPHLKEGVVERVVSVAWCTCCCGLALLALAGCLLLLREVLAVVVAAAAAVAALALRLARSPLLSLAPAQ